jgi:cell division protein FtsL
MTNFIIDERAHTLTTLTSDSKVTPKTKHSTLDQSDTPAKRSRNNASRMRIPRVIQAIVCFEILAVLVVSCLGVYLVWWKYDVQRDTLVQWVMFLLKEREKKA